METPKHFGEHHKNRKILQHHMVSTKRQKQNFKSKMNSLLGVLLSVQHKSWRRGRIPLLSWQRNCCHAVLHLEFISIFTQWGSQSVIKLKRLFFANFSFSCFTVIV